MRRQRRVKIVATLGPASSDPAVLERLFEAGVDVFRINMSHTSHEAARKLHTAVRTAETRFKRPIGILCDLQGPKFRVGEFAGGRVFVREGALFRFDRAADPGTPERVCLPHPQVFDSVAPGRTLLLDDGKIRMTVVEKTSAAVTAQVVVGGALSSRKGLAMPDTVLPISPLTDKDKADLDYMLRLGVDWVALSFVQRGEDVTEARAIVGSLAAVMVKIEKPAAIAELNAIIAAADAIMVARGDLGVEMPLERVPGLQKRITRLARAAGKPVIVATQMLESMITAPVPTRAEVSDVATAVFDGADAIMLSAESAAGQYPAEAVATMDRIAREVEKDPAYDALVHATQTPPLPTGADAIAAAAHTVAGAVKLVALVCYTATGSTALRVARERPGLPIIGITPILATGRKLALLWGTHPVLTGDAENLSHMVRKACRIAFEEGFAAAGEGIVITAGVPLGTAGTTNMVRIAFLDDTGEPVGEPR
ncbi:MAG: pyruvate kinase [Hyphomicrobiaceae bacterium]